LDDFPVKAMIIDIPKFFNPAPNDRHAPLFGVNKVCSKVDER